ncbi:unnamed protein product [Chrysoparadoxa australica]
MKDFQEIISLLPYTEPFLFVDAIQQVDEEGIIGTYHVKKDEYFFEGHFPLNPIMPGVILIEVMAQIGLVSFGIFLLKSIGEKMGHIIPVFTSSKVDFLDIVKPGDQLQVHSKKVYYRFNKLKCKVECLNLTTNKVVCRGELDGLILKEKAVERS